MSATNTPLEMEAAGAGTRLTRLHWIALVFCLINLVFFNTVASYSRQGGQLLRNADFARGLDGWRVEGPKGTLQIVDGTLKIDHQTIRQSTALSQCLPAGSLPERVELSADAGSRAVVRGEAPWHDAHVDLVGYNARGAPDYRGETRLFSLDGDRAWNSYQAVFQKPAAATLVCLRVSLFAAPGAFEVKRLSLYGVADNPLYLMGSRTLLLGWALLGLWLVSTLFRNYRFRPQGRYLLLLLPLLLGGILMPQAARLSIEHHLLPLLSLLGLHFEAVKTLAEPGHWALWPTHWDLSKFAHLTGFALLSIVLFSDRRVSVTRGYSALLLLAVATELMQFFVPERTPRLSDVIVDAAGAGLGLVLILFVGQFLPPRTAEQVE